MYGERAEKQLYTIFQQNVADFGLIHVLRKGVKDSGMELRFAYFQPPSHKNEELVEKYHQNILTCTRQFAYSTQNHNTIDMVLSLNGIPVVAIELKNQLKGQNVENGKRQWREDRDPKEPLFHFNSRILAYFAAEWSLTYGYHHTTLHSTAVDGTTYDWNIPRHTLSARVAPQLVIHTRCPLSLTVGTGLGFSTENLHDISSKSAYYLIENIFNYSEIDLNLGASHPLTDRLTVAAEIIYDILTYETAYSELPTLFDHFNCQLFFSLRYTFKRTSSNNP